MRRLEHSRVRADREASRSELSSINTIFSWMPLLKAGLAMAHEARRETKVLDEKHEMYVRCRTRTRPAEFDPQYQVFVVSLNRR